MYAWVDTVMDYDTFVYYRVSHWGYYYKNGVIMDSFGAWNDLGEDAYSEEFFPYDPNADYTIESYPNLIARVRHDYAIRTKTTINTSNGPTETRLITQIILASLGLGLTCKLTAIAFF